jgi:hypothetical protein
MGDLGSLTESDLAFRYRVKERFVGPRFGNLYRSWSANRIPETDIRAIIGGRDESRSIG